MNFQSFCFRNAIKYGNIFRFLKVPKVTIFREIDIQ